MYFNKVRAAEWNSAFTEKGVIVWCGVFIAQMFECFILWPKSKWHVCTTLLVVSMSSPYTRLSFTDSRIPLDPALVDSGTTSLALLSDGPRRPASRAPHPLGQSFCRLDRCGTGVGASVRAALRLAAYAVATGGGSDQNIHHHHYHWLSAFTADPSSVAARIGTFAWVPFQDKNSISRMDWQELVPSSLEWFDTGVCPSVLCLATNDRRL